MKSKSAEKIKTYEAKGFREKFLGEDNPIHLLFKSNSDHFFCLEIEEMMQMQHPVPPSKHSCHTLIFISSGQHVMKLGYQEYATTDNEMLASGAPTVWYSKDLKNWYNYTMEIPSFTAKPITNFWAPDIVVGNDGKYYLYFGNCEIGCNIYGYVSDTPVGPWKKLNENDEPVISNGCETWQPLRCC